tara:strand:- start:1380 stop:2204 length:825 start_codon:yes stop_codon:yes gene_type:complete
MADKVSFTDFGTKRKVRKIKRKRSGKSDSSVKRERNSVDTSLARPSSETSVPNFDEFKFPFIEISVLQLTPSLRDSWCEMEVSLHNVGNGSARSINVSFDNLETRGKTMVDELKVDSEILLSFEAKSSSRESVITRMDVFYHTIEGDTFSIVRRDWFPNTNENETVFRNEVPPGEEDKANLYSRKEVMSDDFHIICRKCDARSPANFRICGKCGSRLQKRTDRAQNWGSNLKETTGVQDNREILMQKLRKLGELKDKGMLSDDEFSAAKSKLLK